MAESDKQKINEKIEKLRNLKDSEDLEGIKKAQEDLTTSFYECPPRLIRPRLRRGRRQR